MKNSQIISAICLITVIYMISPFISAIGMGIIFAILLAPVLSHKALKPLPKTFSAAIFTLLVTVLLIVPVTSLTILGVKSGLNELKQTKVQVVDQSAIETNKDEFLDKMFDKVGIHALLVRASSIVQIDPREISDELKKGIGSILSHIGDIFADFIASIPALLVNFAVFLFSLFYFLLDGHRFTALIQKRSFFTPSKTNHLLMTFSELCRSVIMASVIAGGVQATLSALISLAVGIRQFPLVFISVFICSFIPMIGSFPLMAGMSLYQFVAGNTGAGIALAIMAVFISLIDNVVRPQVIKGESNLHPLLAFTSALGGIQIFGFVGIFLGPVLFGFLMEIISLETESGVT